MSLIMGWQDKMKLQAEWLSVGEARPYSQLCFWGQGLERSADWKPARGRWYRNWGIPKLDIKFRRSLSIGSAQLTEISPKLRLGFELGSVLGNRGIERRRPVILFTATTKQIKTMNKRAVSTKRELAKWKHHDMPGSLKINIILTISTRVATYRLWVAAQKRQYRVTPAR